MAVQNSWNNRIIQAPTIDYGSIGALYYKDAADRLVALPIGLTGQILSVNASNLPVWQTGSAPSGNAGGDLTGSTYPNPTISNNAVTLAKIADITTASILGRVTAGTGDPEVLTAAQARSVLGLGTAALVNTGNAVGNVPLIEVGGFLNTSVIPPLRSHEFVQVANQAARLALTTSQVQPGDEAFQIDTSETYKLIATNPSIAGNWVLISDLTLDASAIVSGSLPNARLASNSPTTGQVLFFDGTNRVWSNPSGGTPTIVDISTDVTLTNGAIHYIDSIGSRLLALPSVATRGSQILLRGLNNGGYRVIQAAGQSIRFNESLTATGVSGYVRTDPNAPRSSLTLECITANTTWYVTQSNGNFLVDE